MINKGIVGGAHNSNYEEEEGPRFTRKSWPNFEILQVRSAPKGYPIQPEAARGT